MKKTPRMITEGDKLRGEVPSRIIGYKDKVFSTYLKELNPRANDNVQQALAASKDVRFQEFLERVMDPRYMRVNYATIAKGCGISLMEFTSWWGSVQAQVAIATAQKASPVIVQDMADDARTKDVFCDRCEGVGVVMAPPGLPGDLEGYRMIQDGPKPLYVRVCPKCGGTKQIKKIGDMHARDTVLELAGVMPKTKAPILNLNLNGVTHASAVVSLDEAMSIDDAIDTTAENV